MNVGTASNRIYVRVSRDLMQRIARGEFGPGSRLPPERDLAQAYNVSRPTVREAIIALAVDGLVAVRQGSGVYVVSRSQRGGITADTDIGPFELLEARRMIEGEACALAVKHVSNEQLADLDSLVRETGIDNMSDDIVRSEQADRRFHVAIANATGNSALTAVVGGLWDMRFRSPQHQLLTRNAHAAGIKPRVEEHVAIVEALRSRDANSARRAMHAHLGRVLNTLLEITEIHEVDMARGRVRQQRRRFVGD